MNDFDRKFGPGLLGQVPAAPGIYRFFDVQGTLIYVGKAKELRRRLAQYRLTSRKKRSRKRRVIVREATRLEWQVCASHLEACLLEVAQIQAHRPRWNVAGAYSFMYPLIGIRSEPMPSRVVGRQVPARGAGNLRLWLCYTTRPQAFSDYSFHGAYRSRGLTRGAFFALVRLLGYVGQPVNPRSATSEKYSWLFGVDGLTLAQVQALEGFLRGQDNRFLRGLVIGLIDIAPARQAPQQVQERLEVLEVFFRNEAQKLAWVCQATGHGSWPVPQDLRDGLWARAREVPGPGGAP